MQINDWMAFQNDDLLDESTIELFRQYLREVLRGKERTFITGLTWADN